MVNQIKGTTAETIGKAAPQRSWESPLRSASRVACTALSDRSGQNPESWLCTGGQCVSRHASAATNTSSSVEAGPARAEPSSRDQG